MQTTATQNTHAPESHAQDEVAPRFRPMMESDLDSVMAIENVIYTHPWTRGNFVDSLAVHNHCRVLEWRGVVVGYTVLATGADEAHLLNLGVAAAWQRRGLGREILHHVIELARVLKVQKIFLEVRASNAAARALYAQSRFREIGLRRSYYPAHAAREDAIVLECVLGYAA